MLLPASIGSLFRTRIRFGWASTVRRSYAAASKVQVPTDIAEGVLRPPRETEYVYQRRIYKQEVAELRKKWLEESNIKKKEQQETKLVVEEERQKKELEAYKLKEKEEIEMKAIYQEKRKMFSAERREIRAAMRKHREEVDKQNDFRPGLIEAQQQLSTTFITMENMTEAIRQALGQPVNYDSLVNPLAAEKMRARMEYDGIKRN